MKRILCISLATALLANAAQAQNKKTTSSVTTSAIPIRKHISELEAKSIHQDNLAKKGKTKFRSGYKRTDMEMMTPAGDIASNTNTASAHEKRQRLDNKITRVENKVPKFIDGIVMNRN